MIWKHLESLELHHSGEVTRRLAQSTQTYSLWVGETQVTLTKPSLRGVQKRRQKPQPGVPLRVRVVVSELRQPGVKPLRWVLPNQPHRVRAFRRGTLPGALEN